MFFLSRKPSRFLRALAVKDFPSPQRVTPPIPAFSPVSGIAFVLPPRYPLNMKMIPLPTPGAYSLLLAPRECLPGLFELAAELACRGPLRVLDGGNTFNVYELARSLRRRLVDYQPTLQRVELARAFTCHQMVLLLEEAASARTPTLVLDLLATFGDEGVRLSERLRLFSRALSGLRCAGQHAPLLVWARPNHGLTPGQSAPMLRALARYAGQTWEIEPPAPVVAVQPALFGG